MNIKIQTLIVALAAGLPLGAPATPPDPTTTTVMVHCTYGQWPTRDQVANYLRIPKVTVGEAEAAAMDAPSQATEVEAKADVWRIQQFVRKQGRYECEQGATHVQVDFHPQAGDRAVAAVARAVP